MNKYEFNLDEPAYHDKEQGTCRIASGSGNIQTIGNVDNIMLYNANMS